MFGLPYHLVLFGPYSSSALSHRLPLHANCKCAGKTQMQQIPDMDTLGYCTVTVYVLTLFSSYFEPLGI